jgi:hypothetical protein
MERSLVVLGSAVLATVLGYGVVSASPAPPEAASATAIASSLLARAKGPALRRPQPVAPSEKGIVDWALLTSYEYQAGLADVPDAIRALDGTKVTMRGFLMPLYEFDDIHEFVLVATHMSCCFGIPAGVNGQVLVRLSQKDGLPNTNEPIQVTGTFRVREKSEEGYVISIYDLEDASAFVRGY